MENYFALINQRLQRKLHRVSFCKAIQLTRPYRIYCFAWFPRIMPYKDYVMISSKITLNIYQNIEYNIVQYTYKIITCSEPQIRLQLTIFRLKGNLRLTFTVLVYNRTLNNMNCNKYPLLFISIFIRNNQLGSIYTSCYFTKKYL